MKFILWNVRGACRDEFIPHARHLVNIHKSTVFVFLETKSDDLRARQIMLQLGFHDFKAIEANDKRGGIWLLWKSTVDIADYKEDFSFFHVLFHFKNTNNEALITGMHAPSTPKERHEMWREMQSDLPPPGTPWLLFGDLNEVTSQNEKSGGRIFRHAQCKDMNNFTNAAGLFDLGYNGNPFTWSNAREGATLIKQRLDRALGQHGWINFLTQRNRGGSGCFEPFNKLSAIDNGLLANYIPSMIEVKNCLFSMEPMKCRPDGVQPRFFQAHWDSLSHILYKLCADSFSNASFNPEINKSYISLIPKVDNPVNLTQFRPIGLCNTAYKLITKLISFKLRSFLNNLVSPLQSSFIHGRGIEDNVIIIKEMSHIFHKARIGKNIMALKLDLTKAYDSLEWNFIEETLIGFNFPMNFVKLIMFCITSPQISVLWNGEITSEFTPSRGIRQGDPMSSYIFVLCLERLSPMIENKVNQKLWKPIKVTKSISLSHIFYADDVFLFGQASKSNIGIIMKVLQDFGDISGLRVNQNKSTVIFPKKMNYNIRKDLITEFNFTSTSSFGKYLGVEIHPNKLKKGDYFGLLDKTFNQIKGWQSNLLNMAGRCTLVKSVLSSFPVYLMQTSILPFSVCEDIERNCRKFLWNKVDKSRYSTRLGWNHITKPMEIGGLGIRRLKLWNMAFMAKLGWMILTKPDKLWVRILSEKYLKRGGLFDCHVSPNHSQIWKDILKGRELLASGLRVGIGNGSSTSLWYHHWLGSSILKDVMICDIPPHMDNWKVSNIIKDRAWYLNDILHLLPQHVINMIKATPLSKFTDLEDFITWDLSKDGIFSVRSAYHFLLKGKCQASSNINSWKESHIHIFRDCFSSSILWNDIFNKVYLPNNFNFDIFKNSSWEIWINYNLGLDKKWKMNFVTALWHLWLHRNNTECKSRKGKEQISSNSDWKAPREGFFKINTDGAWLNSAVSSGGGVIRRSDGSWYVGFSCKYDAISPFLTELYAMNDGLSIAMDLGIKKVIVETDAKVLRDMLMTSGPNPHHELAATICDVAAVLSKFEVAVVTHIPREGNELSHRLDVFGREMVVGYKTHYLVPECVSELYESEKANVAEATAH
ncbi:uncharacterized protein LOC110719145 [Chenopodium quinoa]|uniref:uncharacterized protein LOC110719145 n=1 Tax=Chenopodium quinoa TaxID=63459 RepID=UPI000B78BE22|nr:uncharacterized protein LOC110719145 [Chenopodium quinoa]